MAPAIRISMPRLCVYLPFCFTTTQVAALEINLNKEELARPKSTPTCTPQQSKPPSMHTPCERLKGFLEENLRTLNILLSCKGLVHAIILQLVDHVVQILGDKQLAAASGRSVAAGRAVLGFKP